MKINKQLQLKQKLKLQLKFRLFVLVLSQCLFLNLIKDNLFFDYTQICKEKLQLFFMLKSIKIKKINYQKIAQGGVRPYRPIQGFSSAFRARWLQGRPYWPRCRSELALYPCGLNRAIFNNLIRNHMHITRVCPHGPHPASRPYSSIARHTTGPSGWVA